MGGRREQRAVTLGDVAAEAGVSLQTVSNAINAPHRLAPATLARTLAAIEALGYKPNRAARSLRNQRSRLIGVKVEPARADHADLLHDQFLHALSVSAAERGYHLILCSAADEREELAVYDELLRTTAVEAFVLAATHRDDPRNAWLRERGVVFATFGRSWDGDDETIWVDVDGHAGTEAVVEHLVALGHRRIGYLGWGEDSDVGRDRRRGWLDACRAHGLPTRGLEAQSDDDFALGQAAAGRLLDRSPRPTAVVCSSDTLALACVRALAARGLSAGADVSVSGFDDSPSSALTTPGLTTVRQPLHDVARALVAHVDTALTGQQAGPRHTLLSPTLVPRESTVAPPPTTKES